MRSPTPRQSRISIVGSDQRRRSSASYLIGADGARIISRTGGWPSGEINVAGRDYFVALQTDAGLGILDQGADRLESGGVRVIPVAHKLHTTDGGFAGLAVATLPVSDFETLYGAVPLGGSGVISLMRRDGTVLAQFPQWPGTENWTPSATVLAALADGVQGVPGR